MNAFKTCRNCHEKDVTVVRGVCATCRIDMEREQHEVAALAVSIESLVKFSPAALRAMGASR